MNKLIPLFYTFNCRLKSQWKLIISFLYFNFACQLYSIFIEKLNTEKHIIFILTILGTQIIYELGYLYNDNVSHDLETNSNWRSNIIYKYSKEFHLILKSRLIYISIIVFLLFIFEDYFENILLIFLILGLTFFIHNNIRKKLRFITFFFLRFSKLLPAGLFMSENSINIYISFITIYSLIETTHYNKKIYQYNFLLYVLLSISCIIICNIFAIKYIILFLIPIMPKILKKLYEYK